MERYIGLDVHAASTTAAVISEKGKRLGSQVVETNGRALITCLQQIPGRRHVCLEEGTQATWLYELLKPHVEEIVVLAVTESRGQKNDEIDAFGLAERLRIGAGTKRVYKERGGFRELGELSRVHWKVVQDHARVQNRVKALFRGRGVPTTGRPLYVKARRANWLRKLPGSARGAAELLYAEYDALQEVRAKAEKALIQEAHRHPVTRLLETCPGLGPIRVANLVSVVVSPGRFRTKRQLWNYSGLGVVTRSSSDWVQTSKSTWVRAQVAKTRGLNLAHNHRLKDIFKGAATTTIAQRRTNPLRQQYERLLAAGTKPNLAKLTIARKIAATALAMWKHEEAYDPNKYQTAAE